MQVNDHRNARDILGGRGSKMSYRILTVIVACSLAAACSPGDSRAAPYSMTTSESASTYYAYAPGTVPYTTCVQRMDDAHFRNPKRAANGETLVSRDASDSD
jgi:hypothetical protein